MSRLLLIFIAVMALAKPAVAAETGYPAAPYSGTWFNQQVQTDSSPPMQAAYVGWLLAEANRLDARLVTWFFSEDINKYLKQEVKRQPEAASLAALAMNLGLYDQQARPRPALEQWQTWKRKPLPIKQGLKGDQ
jgi:hypothetical protein